MIKLTIFLSILGSLWILLGFYLIIIGFIGIYKRFSYSDYRGKDRVIINILYGIIFAFIGMSMVDNFILNLIISLLLMISLIVVVIFDSKTKNQDKRRYGGGPSDGA